MPHAASMPCKLAGTQRLGHVYRVATLYYVLVGRCVAAYTNGMCYVTHHQTCRSCLVSFASAERGQPTRTGRVARVSSEKSMQIRMNHRSCSARPARCTAPLADKENLDGKTEGVPTLLVGLSITIITHSLLRWKVPSYSEFRVAVSISQRPCVAATRVLAAFCRLPLPETARKRSDAMLDPCSPRLGSTVWCIRESVGREPTPTADSGQDYQTPFDD